MKHGYSKNVAVRVPGTGTGTAGYGKKRTGYGKNVPGTFALFLVRLGTPGYSDWVLLGTFGPLYKIFKTLWGPNEIY